MLPEIYSKIITNLNFIPDQRPNKEKTLLARQMLRSGSESHVKGLVQREVETPEFCNFSSTSNRQGNEFFKKWDILIQKIQLKMVSIQDVYT